MIFFFLLGFIEATNRIACNTIQPAKDEIIFEEIKEEEIDIKEAELVWD